MHKQLYAVYDVCLWILQLAMDTLWGPAAVPAASAVARYGNVLHGFTCSTQGLRAYYSCHITYFANDIPMIASHWLKSVQLLTNGNKKPQRASRNQYEVKMKEIFCKNSKYFWYFRYNLWCRKFLWDLFSQGFSIWCIIHLKSYRFHFPSHFTQVYNHIQANALYLLDLPSIIYPSVPWNSIQLPYKHSSQLQHASSPTLHLRFSWLSS